MIKNKKMIALILGIIIVVSLIIATRYGIATFRGIVSIQVGYIVIAIFITTFVAAIVFGCSLVIVGIYLAIYNSLENDVKMKPDKIKDSILTKNHLIKTK